MIGNPTNEQGRTLEGVMGDCKSLFQLPVHRMLIGGCWEEPRWDGMEDRDGQTCSYRREVKSKASGFVSFSSQPLSSWHTCVRMQLEIHYSGLGFPLVSGNSGNYNCQCSVWPSSAPWNVAQPKTMGCVMQWGGQDCFTDSQQTQKKQFLLLPEAGPTTAGMALGSVPQGRCHNFGCRSSLLTDYEADAKTCMYVHKGKASRLLAGRVTTITHRIINGVNSDKLISHFIHWNY